MATINFCDLKRKEVINLCDGARLGCICDLEMDACSGAVYAIIVPGPLVIPYNKITKIGDDVILVDIVL